MRWIRRVLTVLLVLPLLALTALLLAGQRENAGRNLERLVIARPPAEVFRHLVEGDFIRGWTGLSEVDRLTPGDVRPGSRLRLVREARGRRMAMEAEVTGLERDRLLTVLIRSEPGSPVSFTQTTEYRLDDRAGRGTRLSVTTDTHYGSVLARLFEPLLTRTAQRQLEGNLARLKAQVENQPFGD